MSKVKTITEKQRKVLELLYEYKSLDTTTISRTVDPNHTLQATVITLARMKAGGLLISRSKRPGPTLYSLSTAGAQAIGKELGSQHRRKPGRNILKRRKSQLVLENEATTRGFIYYRPVPTSPTVKAKPEYSELRKVLVEHYLVIEREKLNSPEARRRLDYEERLRNLKAGVTPMPIACREYYLHRPHQTGAIVILSGIQTTRRYWQKRMEEYQVVAGHLWVVAVFYSKPPAELTRQLKEAGFMPILLENLGAFLDKYLPDKGNQGLKSASPGK